MTTSYYAVAPPGPQQPPRPTRSRRYIGWAVFLFFVPPTLVAVIAIGLTLNDARNEVRIEAANGRPVTLEPGGYFFATPAAKPGSKPCRLVDLTTRPPTATRLDDARHYSVTHQEREFVNRGSLDIMRAGRYRVVCPDAARLIVLRYARLGSWILFVIPAALLVAIGQLVAVVMFFRMGRRR